MRSPARVLIALAVGLGALAAPALGAGPLGSPQSWTHLSPDKARWNPCAPIRYAVDERATPGALADVREALRRVGQESGLVFSYQGRTAVVPTSTTPAPGAQADVVVAFVPHGHPAWNGSTANGYARVASTSGFRADGTRAARLHAGYIVLDPASTAEPGFVSRRGRVTRGQILLHEGAHVAGLGHVDDPTQLMNPVSVPHDSAWGAGDLAGLNAVGAVGGCLYRTSAEARAGRAERRD